MPTETVLTTTTVDPAAAVAAAKLAAEQGTNNALIRPWYDGKADAELVGHMQNKGWADKPADVVALEAIRSHRESEKFLGVPADQLLRLPKELTDPTLMKPIWQRLGAPADPKDYDFSAVKTADGKAPDQAFIDFARTQADKYHMPVAAATEWAQNLVKFNEGVAAAGTADKAATQVREAQELQKNWGANFEAFKLIAGQAAAKYGFTAEMVGAMQSVAGYAKTMEMFRTLAQQSGESKWIEGSGDTKGALLSRSQAKTKIEDLKHDEGFVKRYLAGDVAAIREMTNLTTIMVGDEMEGI